MPPHASAYVIFRFYEPKQGFRQKETILRALFVVKIRKGDAVPVLFGALPLSLLLETFCS